MATLNESITLYRNDVLDNTKTLVRTGASAIKFFMVNNPNAAQEIFLQVHDAAATGDVTLGTTVPTLPIKVPAAGFVVLGTERNPLPVPFLNGIVIAATTAEKNAVAPGTPVSVLLSVE